MIYLGLTEKEREGLTKDEQEMAMARKLEFISFPYLRRNIDFFYGSANFPKKAKAYNEKMDKEGFEEIINGKDKKLSIPTVCKPICDMFVEILKENGLHAEAISCDTDMFKHTDVLITTTSGKKYIINYLEDMESIQTGMNTPDFACKKYYERRYEKFEGTTTTNGVSLEGIDFLEQKSIDKIDKNLGYKKQNMYMNSVINQIKEEFENFREVMAENESATINMELEEKDDISAKTLKDKREEIYNKYRNMDNDDVLEAKLDWIFQYFNDRSDLNGYTDFTMYYTRLLLKQVLSKEEYQSITRCDGSINKENVSKINSEMKDVLDLQNPENERNIRFCLLTIGEKGYLFSTKANKYLKLDDKQIEELNKYAKILEIERPSDLLIKLRDKGNALPLAFHPLGVKIVNERASLINKKLTQKERTEEIEKLLESIKATDEPVTGILIPYPNGESKYIYINKDNEFTVREGKREKVYHYDEESDSFKTEEFDCNDDIER